jgi:hypothetical protein
MGTAIGNVEVDGTLYQGSASAIPVTNTQTVPVTNGAVTVSETFSNVVPANNDWVIFEFYAVAADGSKTQLGSLGTFVNVGATTTTANLGTASTQVLQVAGSLLNIGALSTYDIEQTPNLPATLASDIGALGVAVNSQTGLYDSSTLITITEDLATAFERDITITAPGATEVSLAADTTKADENDLAYNVTTFDAAFGIDVTTSGAQPAPTSNGSGVFTSVTVIASPIISTCCGEPASVSVPMHGPSSGYSDAQPARALAYIFSGSGTVTIKNVYGGHLIVGAHNGVPGANAPPSSTPTASSAPYGATIAIAGEGPGPVTESLSLASTLQTVQVVDTQAVAFGASTGYYGSVPAYNGNPSFGFAVLAGANAAGTIPAYYSQCETNCTTAGLIQNSQFYLGDETVQESAPNASGISTLSYDSWNAFNLPASQIEICGFAACGPLTSSSPVNVTAAFLDNGSNDAVYSWTASTPAGATIANNGGFYAVTYPIPANNTQPLTVTLTGTVPVTYGTPPAALKGSVYIPGRAEMYLYQGNLQSDESLTMTLTDTSGKSYSVTAPATSGEFVLENPTPFALGGFSLTITLPASEVENTSSSPTTGFFSISTFYVGGSNANGLNDGCC